MSDLRDVVAATEARLRQGPGAAAALVEELAGALLREGEPRAAARVMLALATAHLAADQVTRARELLRESLPLLGDPSDALRARVRLAAAEAALGERRAARRLLGEVPPRVLLDLREPDLRREVAAVLDAAGERLAAACYAAAPGGASPVGARLDALRRLVGVLSSCAVGTAEPLYAALRAILDESGADRGFLMLYEGSALRFRLGLSSAGRILGAQDFAYSSTIVERALRSRDAVLVADVAREAPLAQASSARELGLRSAACVPLRVERKRVGAAPVAALPTVRGLAGVLYVDGGAATRFDPEQAAFFEACAACAVLAVREAQTLEELQAARARPGAAPPRAAGPLHQGEAPCSRLPGLVTRDPAFLEVIGRLERAASSPVAVLIRGESGTGKELLARALHAASPRAGGPFVVVDCGALPEELAAAELLGHERGAFTGAVEARAGLIERAHGGTLLLDEVGDLPLALQGALLRVLQEGEVRRVGGDAPRRVDVRVVATTQRDLRALVERRELRQDLLYRIAGLELRVPPLRERPGDVPLLVAHLLEVSAEGDASVGIEEAAVLRLLEHPWAGNVRELENVLLRARLDVGEGAITLADVDRALDDPAPAPAPDPAAAPAPSGLTGTLEEIERAVIAERLAETGGNQAQAARTLGIDRNTLRRKMLRYGIARR